MLMDYKYFQAEDFLQNEFFLDWVLRPNPESDHFWVNWINGHPEKRKEVEVAKELVKSIHYQEYNSLKPNEYSLLMENILQHREPKRLARYIGFAFRNSFKIAAGVSLLIALFFASGIDYSDKDTVQEVPQVSWTITSTLYGQKKTIHLPDGTKVIMNSGSTIEYPTDFSTSDTRTVKFQGEAFFDVSHNPQKPFVIESGALTTRVLGTSFNLNSFEEEEEVSVSVLSGKVEIKSETGETALLLPNEMGVFNKAKQDINQKHFDKNKLVAWTHGILLFENEDLSEIISRLEKWYGVSFVILDGVKLEGKYSGEYKRKSLELVLEGLSYTSNFNYKINQKTITIYERKK